MLIYPNMVFDIGVLIIEILSLSCRSLLGWMKIAILDSPEISLFLNTQNWYVINSEYTKLVCYKLTTQNRYVTNSEYTKLVCYKQ